MNKDSIEFDNEADARQYVEECWADMELASMEYSDMNII
jgi:hypothetical protein|nr:MAG TPA: hypothetical protein [Crassvirales sp.]